MDEGLDEHFFTSVLTSICLVSSVTFGKYSKAEVVAVQFVTFFAPLPHYGLRVITKQIGPIFESGPHLSIY